VEDVRAATWVIEDIQGNCRSPASRLACSDDSNCRRPWPTPPST